MRTPSATRFATALAIAFGAAWAAQDGADDTRLETLRTRLTELDAELAEEREALAQAKLRAETDDRDRGSARQTLAAELVDLQIAVADLEQRKRSIERSGEEAREQTRRMQKTATALDGAARTLAEQLRIHLREVPGQDETAAALDALVQPAAGAAWNRSDHPQRALAALDAALESASQITRQTASVHTSAGTLETVSLLTAGHIGFAYKTSDGRLGLALAAPTDARGYRWTEDVPDTLRPSLEEAFATDGSSITLPLDVSGQVRIDHTQDDESLISRLKAGGLVMLPLVLVAVLALAMIVERAWMLYVRNRFDGKLVQRILDQCADGRFDDAEALASRGSSVATRTLAICLERRDEPLETREESVQEHLLGELPKLERFLGGIASLAAVAPLLGLLGTVTGIIETFGVIRSFGNANPGLMAGGISEALVTTAAGMSIAIPVLLLHVVLRGRVDQMVRDAERHAATLLHHLTARP